jgi:hypothetical protein
MITFNKGGENTFKCMVGTQSIGYISQENDGFHYFFPTYRPGSYWDSSSMKAVTMKLEALNEAWSQKLNEAGVV